MEREISEHIDAFLAQPKVLKESRSNALARAGQDHKRMQTPQQLLPATNTGRNHGFVMHAGLQPQDYDDLRAQAPLDKGGR